jgi:hypothetical protein
METSWQPEPSSFRDPNGFVFHHEGAVYRQINSSGHEEYRRLVDSGLYSELAREGFLVSHEEVDLRIPGAPPAAAVIRPERLPFISYPYEWCFGQLKAAALLTLAVQKRALARDLILRDASAFNVQFIGSRPIFIDTLSFGAREDGAPWPGYRQFCQHFLAPLALCAWGHPGLLELSRVYIDGVPLDVARAIVPGATWLRPGLVIHLHLHGRSRPIDGGDSDNQPPRRAKMTKTALLALTESLERTIEGLKWNPPPTLWSAYTGDCNYTTDAQDAKRRVVAEFLESIAAQTNLEIVWDFGANTGDYSRVAAKHARHVVSFDLDPAVVERHFRACRERGEEQILPLVQDLTNPTSAIGWHHRERRSLLQRGPADAALALALIHHLALGGNVPLDDIAAFLREACRYLIIEFVPKTDSQVRRMLSVRGDIFPQYSATGFEKAFKQHFEIVRSTTIAGTERILYLMRPK